MLLHDFVSFFVATVEQVIVWCISDKQLNTVLRKIVVSTGVLEYFGKIL